MSEVVGWAANVALVVGNWHVGNRRRWAFLVVAAGEAAWVVAAALKRSPSMAFICAAFGLLAVRNWHKLKDAHA